MNNDQNNSLSLTFASLFLILLGITIAVVITKKNFVPYWRVVFPTQLIIALGGGGICYTLIQGDFNARLLVAIAFSLVLLDNLDSIGARFQVTGDKQSATKGACQALTFDKGMRFSQLFSDYRAACKAGDVEVAARVRAQLYSAYDPLRACRANNCDPSICATALYELDNRVTCERPLALPEP